MENIKNEKSNAGFLIFLCWLVYTASYLGKVNYSANIIQIIDFYGITKSQAGMVPTFMFFSYGIGQVVNGILCKRYNPRWIIFLSLFASSAINLIIAVTNEFYIIKWLWMANGFLLSVLWPTLVRLLSESLPVDKLGRSSVVMGTTVATGTLIVYSLSSLYAALDMFKLAFYTAAIVGCIVSVLWIIFYNRATCKAKAGIKEENSHIVQKYDNGKKASSLQEKKLFYASVIVLCICAVGVNLIKDGLTTWVPSILKDEYNMSNSISILLTLFLPIVAIFGNAYALHVHKKIPDYVTHCSVVFVLMAVLISVIIGCLSLRQAVVMLLSLVIVSFLASSLNSLITSIYPIFMREKINSGLYAGVLNGFCYLGSTISSYGLGYIADHFGWNGVFYLLIGVCWFVGIIWCVYKCFKKALKA